MRQAAGGEHVFASKAHEREKIGNFGTGKELNSHTILQAS